MPRPPVTRWRRRPLLSAALRFFVVAIPMAAAFATSAGLTGAMRQPRDTGELIAWWAIALAASSGVFLIVHRAAQRLLPLAVLLRLSLLFPDHAPSRLRVARSAASTSKLAASVERARRAGKATEPVRAAEQILTLVAAVEAHDRATRGHSERVRVYTDLLADEMELSQHARDRLRWAALLHDVGKIRVPGAILNKAGPLDDTEWEAIKAHPAEGARLTGPLRAWLGSWARAIEEHHERYDGTGYPRGLAGHGISLAGRIVAVTDAFETMTAYRPYKRPKSAAAAREELVRCAGDHFDPVVVRAFLRVSLGRLSLVTGPLAWLAQTPVLRGLEVAAESAGRFAAGAAVGGSLILAGPAAPAGPSERPPAIERRVAADTPEGRRPTTSRDGPTAEPSPSSTPTPSPPPSPDPSPTPTDPVKTPPPRPPGPWEPPTPSPTTSKTADPRPEPSGETALSAGGIG